jgi:signal transduction histidine kinase
VKVGITDHGLGLPAEALDRLFTNFYRVDNSDRRSIKGTGLGLPICQTIIASHGGRIWAESEGLGRGASVRTRPAHATQAALARAAMGDDRAGPSAKAR